MGSNPSSEMRNKCVLSVMGMESSKYGGLEHFNVFLSQRLFQHGYRSVFVYESYPADQRFVDDLQESNARVVVSDARHHPIRFCIDFIKLLRKYRPTIVHAHFTKARFYAIPIARLFGIRKLFFTVHSSMDSLETIHPWTRIWYRFANRYAKVITVSNQIASTYLSNWPESTVKRIYLGVINPVYERSSSRRSLGIPEDCTMLLTIANFNYIKGLDVLIRAMARLKQNGGWNRDGKLFIVGQPEADLQELSALIHALDVGNEVVTVGISNRAAEYLASADIYIQPSRSEGTPLSLMEAASYSLPLIGSKVGGIPEVIRDGENGLLVAPEDDLQLMGAISTLLCNPEMRRRLGNASFITYQNTFTIEKGIKQTLDYYNLE